MNPHTHIHLLKMAILPLMLMLMLHSPWHARVAEAAASTAKPGCRQQCGTTVVPYPFGIGSGCFYDEWFEMECADTSSNPNTRPFIKKLKLEALEIQLPRLDNKETGWVLFNNPIIASPASCTTGNKKTNPATTALDMTGSTFYFGAGPNNFAGSGCTNQVSMVDIKGKVLPDTQCISSCPQGSTIGACCKTNMPDALQFFNVSFSGATTDGDGACQYAMIASSDKWLSLNPGTSCSSSMTDTDSVPAWLEWGLRASSPEAVALEKQSTAVNAAVGIYPYTYDDGVEIQFAYCSKGFEGNPYLPDGCQDEDECLTSPCVTGTCKNKVGGYDCIGETSKSTKIAITVGCTLAGVLVIILLVWGGFWLRKRQQEKKFFRQNGGPLLKREGKDTKVFKAHNLRAATNNFNKKNRLGGGGQGTVYKGTLPLPGGPTVVAIKECKKERPSKKSKAVEKSIEAGDEMSAFITEVVLLSETIHKNIVRLLGCCLETESPMLVYEFLVNGDLSHHLQNDKNNNTNNADFKLSWEVRLRIAADIAGALSYLHFSAGIPIYHRDIKSDNILLDHKFTAKLADFGISKSLAANESRVNVEDVRGSNGYLDPEYIDSKQYTDKSDVYSFGVVLAELLTGKRPVFSYTSLEGEEKTMILANHLKSFDTAKTMEKFLDARVKRGKPNEVEAVFGLAKRCLEGEGRNRPNMKDVAMELEKIRAEHTNDYAAEEIEDHDYDQPMESITISPTGGTPARPLKRAGSQTSDA